MSAGPKNSQGSVQNNLSQKIKSVSKPPKLYPDINMQVGQTNAKKIQYTNYDDFEKEILVLSADPKIIYVKTINMLVRAGETVDLRLRFQAPSRPGTFVNKVEIRVNGADYPEETLQFTILNH